MSPEAIMEASDQFASWRQEGFKGSGRGSTKIMANDDTVLININMTKRNGLYYSPIESLTAMSTNATGEVRACRMTTPMSETDSMFMATPGRFGPDEQELDVLRMLITGDVPSHLLPTTGDETDKRETATVTTIQAGLPMIPEARPSEVGYVTENNDDDDEATPTQDDPSPTGTDNNTT